MSNLDQILLVKIATYIGFCVYRRSYLIWSPVIVVPQYSAGARQATIPALL